MAHSSLLSKIPLCGLIAILLLVGCREEPESEEITAVPAPTNVLPTLGSPVPPPATPFSTPTATANIAAIEPQMNTPTRILLVTPSSSPTPHPLAAYTLTGMQAREYPGGEITITTLLDENESFKRYAVDYPSDGLKITGTMNIPMGEGPFPIAILLHGYFPREVYWPGADTWQAADFLARNGYLAIAPDFRSWGGSDSGHSFFHMGLVADTINLISSLPSLPQADPDRVALWGHSMGGGIATKVLVIDQRPLAAVLYAPNSADDSDLINRWGPGCLPGQSEAAGDKCNPGELISPDLPQDLIDNYLAAADDPQFIQQVAPIHHLQEIKVPLQIHIGTADGAALEQTPPDWSQDLYESLQMAGKEVTFFPYPDQGHFFQPAQWQQLMQRTLELFDQELKSITPAG